MDELAGDRLRLDFSRLFRYLRPLTTAKKFHFSWSSGESASYTRWAPGEPNDVGNGEDFVAIYYPNHDQANKWNDWNDRITDPIGLPMNGVVEIIPKDTDHPKFVCAEVPFWKPQNAGKRTAKEEQLECPDRPRKEGENRSQITLKILKSGSKIIIMEAVTWRSLNLTHLRLTVVFLSKEHIGRGLRRHGAPGCVGQFK